MCKRAFIESIPISLSGKCGPTKTVAIAACCININKIDLKLYAHTYERGQKIYLFILFAVNRKAHPNIWIEHIAHMLA